MTNLTVVLCDFKIHQINNHLYSTRSNVLRHVSKTETDQLASSSLNGNNNLFCLFNCSSYTAVTLDVISWAFMYPPQWLLCKNSFNLLFLF